MLHKAYFVCAHVGEETDLELFASPCAMKQKLRDIGSEKDYVRIVYVGECKRNNEGRWTVRIDYEKHGHNGEDTLKSFLPTEDRSTQIAVLVDDKYPATPRVAGRASVERDRRVPPDPPSIATVAINTMRR